MLTGAVLESSESINQSNQELTLIVYLFGARHWTTDNGYNTGDFMWWWVDFMTQFLLVLHF